MKKIIDPGCGRKVLTLLDNIVYSTVTDLDGNALELEMSILIQNGNSEMKQVFGADDPGEDHAPKPALLWIPGSTFQSVFVSAL